MTGDGRRDEELPPALASKVDDLFRSTESEPSPRSERGAESKSGARFDEAAGSAPAPRAQSPTPPGSSPAPPEVGYIADVADHHQLAEWGYDLRSAPSPTAEAGRGSAGLVDQPTGVEIGGETTSPDDFGQVLRGVVRARIDLPPDSDTAPPLGVSTDDLRRALAAFMAAGPDDRPARAMRVRFQAEKLGGVGEHEGVALAVERMLVSRPDDEGVRDLACQLVTDEVARVLTWRLVDRARDEDEGRALARAFGRLNMEMADAVSHTLARTEDRIARRVLTEVLVRLAPEAQEIMADFIQDARWTVVRDAVTVIGRTGIPNAVQFLTTALAHEEPRVRAEALRALGAVGGGEAAVLARSYLDGADAEVRNAAAEAVGALRDPGSVPRLLARLDDESEREGLVALLHALGRIGDVAAFPALEKRAAPGRLGRGPTEVRVAAVRALAALDTADGWTAVEALVDDRDDEVRGLVRFLLRSR